MCRWLTRWINTGFPSLAPAPSAASGCSSAPSSPTIWHRPKIRVYFLNIPSRNLGRRSKTRPVIISLLSLNDPGKDEDANKIDLSLPFSEGVLKEKGLRTSPTCHISSLRQITDNLLKSGNPHYGDQLLPYHLFLFVWYMGACSGQSPFFWRSVRNLYLESSLIKFKEKGCVGIMTIRNGKIGPILGSITDLDGDKEEGHP